MKRTEAPCLDCNGRSPGCHGRCWEYKMWSDWLKKDKESRENERALDSYEYSRAVKCKIWRSEH